MSQKSFNEKNALYLIPTPIGNMDDITIRAQKVLNQVDIIYCEDTRETRLFLNKLGINKKLVSSNEQTEESKLNQIINDLEKGHNVGLVTDRGTPIISDPGYKSVRTVLESGYNVIPLPGANALIPALIASGLNPMPFMFYGFLNSKPSKRKKELEKLSNIMCTIIFYEAPHRIIDTLEDIKNVFGNRKVSVAREISKKYEEFYRGTLTEVIKELSSSTIKGEFVLVVEGSINEVDYDALTVVEHVNMYIDDGKLEKDAIKLVAKDRNIPKSDIYKEYHLRRK